ncbi:M56 family metallopeptidase [Paenibacillus sp. N3.4]|uniref:M56 family metallopeptidase n=1 Tax=Paenibacillus sp. N3.4 TaxID=2603222 RepID=UPI0011C95A0C|nr:M56 family metallopeptidase [Paenibacillus sp. N3.4]TXK76724.1 hypothetical protein FU659_24950 [Paenibacillus sp. N3.4]
MKDYRLTEHLMHFFDWVWPVSTMASVLVVLIIVMQQVLKHRLKPRWHYLMWLLVIVRLVLPWSPESEFSIYNWIGYADSAHSAVQVNQEKILTNAVIPETAAQTVYRTLFVIWLVGMSVLGTYTIRINRRFAHKMKKATVSITDARILEIFNSCKKMMSIDRRIALLQSCDLATPTLFGFVKPQLIMPQTILNSLNDDQLQHVFLHELAHSKRNDIIVNWFMHVLLIIHWFNPVLWYAYRRMREDQEIASDALALSYLAPDKSQDYGYTLIKLLENFAQPVRAVGNVNLTGSKGQLQRRIKMIKQFKSNSYRWSFLGMATILIISGCTLTSPKASETSTQPPSTSVSEQKSEVSSSQVPSSTSDDKTKQTDLAVTHPANGDDKQGSVGAQPTMTDDKSKPAAASGVLSSGTDEQPRTAAPVRALPSGADNQPKAAAPVRVLPSEADNQPKAAPARLLPSEADNQPKAAAPVRALPQRDADLSKQAAPVGPLPVASTDN